MLSPLRRPADEAGIILYTIITMDNNSVTIFTDGASRGNPGPGGWGAVVIFGDKITEIGGRETHTTNNRMELMGAIKALEFVSSLNAVHCTLYTDSGYLIKGITEWMHNWQRKNWRTADRKQVLNRDLWEELLALSRGRKIAWKQVSGHAGVLGNERCDEIATAFAGGENLELYSGYLPNYRIKNILHVS